MTINYNTLKTPLNLTFLTISSLLIIDFMIQLVDGLAARIIAVVFVIALEIFAQFLLGLGRAWLSEGRKTAYLLFAIYGIYVVVYAGMAVLGFFVGQSDGMERTTARAEYLETIDRQSLAQIAQTREALNLQLTKEAETGYGPAAREIVAQLDQLKEDEKNIRRTFQNVPTKHKNVPRNVFRSLENVLGWPENVIKRLVFGVSVLMLYLGLILTAWDVKLDGERPPRRHPGTTLAPVRENSEDKSEFTRFIEGLFDGVNRRLNGNEIIAEKTGIPIERCSEYRDKLVSDGMIIKRQGASVAARPREDILRMVQEG